MANKYPLVANSSTLTIEELRSNDTLLVDNLTTTGISNLGPIANLYLTGGSAGQYLQTDGAGNLSFTTVSVTTSGISNGTSNVNIPAVNGNVTIGVAGNSGVVTVTGTGMVVAGNINPSANVTYNLGNATNRWNNLYLAGNTIVLGNATISANGNAIIMTNPDGGNFVISGNSNTGTSGTSNGTSNVNIPVANGNITFSANGTGNVVQVSSSGMIITGNIIPTSNNTFSLGNATSYFKDAFIGPGSLYINGVKALEQSSNTIVVSADINQSVKLSTSGSGDIQFNPTGSGVIAVKGPLQIQAGNYVTSSNGGPVGFSNPINVDTLSSLTANTNLTITANGSGSVSINDDVTITGNLNVNGGGGNLSVTSLTVEDNIIDISAETTGAPSNNAGLRVVRGDQAATQLRWTESAGQWQFTNDGATYLAMVGSNTSTGNANIGNIGTGIVLASGNITGANIRSNGSANIANGLTVSNGGASITGAVGITGNINVTGNFNVTGNLNYSNVTDLVVGDPLIIMGANNTGNLYDLGIVASFTTGSYYYTGFARDHSDGVWKLFTNVTTEPTTVIDWANSTFAPMKSGAFTSNSTITANGNITGSNIITAGQLVSSIATGTSPLTVTSTTLVTNLNADLLDGYNTATAATANTVAVRNSDGNITANFFVGNGSQLTGLSTNGVSNGNSNVAIATANGNVTIAAVGNTVLTVTGTGVNVAGTITTGAGSGGNISGANYISANYVTGTLTTAAQPNITSVGTLTGLTSLGTVNFTSASNVSLGPVGNVKITGGTNGQYLTTDGAGNLSFGTVTVSSASISNGTSNVNIGSSGGNVTFGVAGNAAILTVTGTGANIAGTGNVTGNLNVGNLTCSAGTVTAATITETSSIALKENLNPITNALDSIVQLMGFTYDRKDGTAKGEAGLIAEEVNNILPNLISYDEKGKPYSINYSKLTVYLIEAMKTLKSELDILKSQK